MTVLTPPANAQAGRFSVLFKLVGLALTGIAAIWVQHVELLTIMFVSSAVILALSGRSPGQRPQLWGSVRSIAFTLLLAGILQWLFVGPERALSFTLTLGIIVMLAAAFSLSTSPSELLDTISRTLAPVVGRDRAERVGLLAALTLRSIPVMIRAVRESADARKARGLERSARALVAPTMVRVVRHSYALGEALRARGFDD